MNENENINEIHFESLILFQPGLSMMLQKICG